VGLLTDQYPPFEGDAPLAYDVDYPDRVSRRRLVLWKILTALPHFFILALLIIASTFVTFIAWWAILFTGKFPRGLHKFVVGVMRWTARVTAYVQSLTDVFPPYSLDEDAGPGSAEPVSALLGGVLLVLLASASIAAAVALNPYSGGTTSASVSYRTALAGGLPPTEGILTLDGVTFELQRGDDAFASDLIKPTAGHHLVALSVGYDNRRLFRTPGHHDLELSAVRLATDAGVDNAVLLTADGVPAPTDITHGRRVAVRAFFDVKDGETPVELRGYPLSTSGRHVVWKFTSTTSTAVANPTQSSAEVATRAPGSVAPSPPQQISAATPTPQAAVGCAKDASVSVVDSPIGRLFHDGERLTVTLVYDTPSCNHVGGEVLGRHAAGTEWYQFLCKSSPASATCATGYVASHYLLPQYAIAPSGTVTLEVNPGTTAPHDLSSVPRLEGFTPCSIRITFNDGAFGGSHYDYDIGAPC
jgi:hypothetical protein